MKNHTKFKIIALAVSLLVLLVACNQVASNKPPAVDDDTTPDTSTSELPPSYLKVNSELEGLVTIDVEVLRDGEIFETISNNSNISIQLSDLTLEYFDGDSWVVVLPIREYEIEGGGVVDVGSELTFTSDFKDFQLPSNSGLFRVRRSSFPNYRQPQDMNKYDLIYEFLLRE